MGYAPHNIHFTEECIKKVFPDPTGLEMLELGDQEIRFTKGRTGEMVFCYPGQGNLDVGPAKQYFIDRGYNHTSVDLKGLRGSEIRDLRKPEQFLDWHDSFDILTNSGTTEHVEPAESQYDCFKILHDVVKVGGIFIHMLPDAEMMLNEGYWLHHCSYYYTDAFFLELSDQCGYKVIDHNVSMGNQCVALQKTDTPFTEDKTIWDLNLTIDWNQV